MSAFLKFIEANWAELLVLTREHIFIVLLATGLAVAIGLPLGNSADTREEFADAGTRLCQHYADGAEPRFVRPC